MNRRILSKALVVGVILFICISIQPAIAVNPNSIDSEDDCDICPKVSSLHLVRLKSLINRVETLNNKLLVLSNHNPEVADRYQELSDRVATIKEINKELKQVADGINNTDFCDLIGFIMVGLSLPFFSYIQFCYETNGFLILKTILLPFVALTWGISTIFWGIYMAFCLESPY